MLIEEDLRARYDRGEDITDDALFKMQNSFKFHFDMKEVKDNKVRVYAWEGGSEWVSSRV